MATVYYTDSSGPTAYTGTRNVGIAGKNSWLYSVPRVTYALYEDTATWTAWTAWAQTNALNTKNIENFSSRALEVYSNWHSIAENEFSFMCVEDESVIDTNRGAWCAEANITSSTGQTLYNTRTWRLSATDVTTKLDAYAPSDRSLKNFSFASTTVTSPALTEIVEAVDSILNYKSFQVINCSLTSTTMQCLNWVVSEEGQTFYSKDANL